jgi:beta-1,4-mannosyl-glycoprotein beta-1,4-N-acetylglucosaminyltransferase
MIYDCFSFFNELDILEIRLNTLNEVVDKFVLVEAPWTHSGNSKPLYFKENKERFKPFLDKIVHIVAAPPPISATATERESAWIRENCQRNEIKRGIDNAQPHDILIISDLDEIPDPQIIKKIISSNNLNHHILNLNLYNYAFFLNNLCISSPIWTGGPQMLTIATFRDPATYKSITPSEYAPKCANPLPSATFIRFAPHKKNVKNAGWHFSYMGGLKAIQKKLLSFSHTELQHIAQNPVEIKNRVQSGKGFGGFCDRYMAEPLENNFPEFIQKNSITFTEHILPASIKKWRYHFLHRAFYKYCKSIHGNLIGILINLIPRPLHPIMRRIRLFIGL